MQNFTDENKTALQIVFIMSEKRRNIGQLDHNDGGSPLKVNKKKNSSSAVQGGPINDNDQINRSNPDTNKSGLPLKVNQKELPVRVRASCKLDDPIDCVSAYKSCSNDKTATVADSKTFSFVEANRPVLSDTNLPSASFRKSDGIAECVAHLPPELLRKIKTFFFSYDESESDSDSDDERRRKNELFWLPIPTANPEANRPVSPATGLPSTYSQRSNGIAECVAHARRYLRRFATEGSGSDDDTAGSV